MNSHHISQVFEAKNILLKPDKAQLLEAIREYLSSSKAPKLEQSQRLIIMSLMVVLFCDVSCGKKDPPIDQLLRCMHRSLWIIMVRPLLS